MENPGGFNFEVGQLAEMRTFEPGYRGAWFRCKIKDIRLKNNKFLPEYYDYDSEKLRWEEIYQVPPHLRKSSLTDRQLMVRPQYPEIYRISEMPAVNLISQACVIINGTWKVGDLVDCLENGCFWSSRVVRVLSANKVQVEMLMPPLGEGGTHEAFCSDLRPSLEWSETEGWTLPTMEGHPSSDAHLIFPTTQAGSTIRKSGDEISVKMEYDLMDSSESVFSCN